MASGIAHSSRAAVPAGPAPAMDRSESESPAWRRRGWRWADAETSEGRAPQLHMKSSVRRRPRDIYARMHRVR
jgi:hypothetical protein